MQEKDKIDSIAKKIQSKLISIGFLWIDIAIKDELNELEWLMNKLIRQWKSKLAREDIQDIIKEFKSKSSRKNYPLFSDQDDNDNYPSYHSAIIEMIQEFRLSLNEEPRKAILSINVDSQDYISKSRIDELRLLNLNNFDISKLIRLCEEVNIAFNNQCYFSVWFLVRIIKDHIPPIFWKENFVEVASNKWNSSIKKSLHHLENSLKHIADDMAHGHISKKEILPNVQTVTFQAELDVLLGLIIKELSK